MILEHFMSNPKLFRPVNIEQYTALQIARRFNDSNLKTYLLAADRHRHSLLLKAYRTAKNATDKQKAFFQLLDH